MRLSVIISVLVSLAGSAAADIVSTPRALNDYGYVQDVNLGNSGGDMPADGDFCQLNNQSCVPTSWTNSLVYLQNKYGIELAGLELAGSDYSAWTETVETLRSPEFMNTSPNPDGVGTTPYGQVNGIEQFLIHKGAGPLATSYQAIAASFMLHRPYDQDPTGFSYPDWLMPGAPTLDLLHQWLEADAAVVIDVLWGEDGNLTGQGHALALVGIEWTDYNDNGIVDKWALDGITAEAFLLVIDPLDPTFGNYSPDGWLPVGPAQSTKMHVWQEPNPELKTTFGMLNVKYSQYKADCGTPFPFADNFPNGDDTYAPTTGWLGGAGALNIIGGPGGSCCLVTGCDVLTETDCGVLGGSWALSGSCDDCPEYCEGDTNGDGYVNIEDLLNMLGSWGACP